MAVEVIVSEGAKAIRGSIGVLEAVSPALGLLIVQDDDIARRLRSQGYTEERIQQTLKHTIEQINDHISHTRQRLDVWTYTYLHRRYHLATTATIALRKEKSL
ncbi:hypothetical protein ADK67_30930 [Saccharothrix sp. NRRL B-16348]|nr:hypothetical protein ADK67_30930 [Saccharothrix sp. NRRL B-16348]